MTPTTAPASQAATAPATWYDHRRVATKSSVVLGKWLQQRPGGIERAGITPVRLLPQAGSGQRRNYAAALREVLP